MALKDLKSDLSKFRRPVEDPLVDKKRVDVPKTSNQTPLSKFLENTPNAQSQKVRHQNKVLLHLSLTIHQTS